MLAGNRVRTGAARYALTRRTLIVLAVAGVMATGPDVRATYLYFPRPVPFLLQRPETTLFYSKELEDESRIGVDGERKKELRTERLTLNFRSSGWVYHPALVTFTIDLRPQFLSKKLEFSSGSQTRDKVDFFGYSVGTTWFKDKRYTISLNSNRDRVDSSSSLATDVTTESRGDRAVLAIKNPILPTRLTYTDSKTVTEGFFRTEFSQKRWQLESEMETGKSETKLTVADMQQERLIRDVETASDRFLATVTNNYAFSADAKLNSILTIADFEAGELSSNSITNLNSNLQLSHRENLHSFYSINLNKNDVQEYGSRSAMIQAGLRHLLYENLTTSLGVTGSQTNFPTGDITAYGGALGFAYNRRIPWGLLSADWSVAETIQDNQVQADFIQVLDESQTFEGISTTIILDNIDIDSDSVDLTDTSRAIVYVRGIDYEVESVGRSTVITRDPFAGIGDDATVLVTYNRLANAPAKTGLTGNSYGMQLTLWENKFRLFFRGSRFEERLIEGLGLFEPRFDRTERTGAQLNLHWSITSVEFEDRKSTTTPLKRRTIRQSFQFRPWPVFSFSFGGQLDKTELVDTGEEYESRGANIGIGWSIGPGRGHLQAGAFTGESRNNDEHGVKIGYRWQFGAWSPRIRYEDRNEFNGFANETRRRKLLYFDVKRRFR